MINNSAGWDIYYAGAPVAAANNTDNDSVRLSKTGYQGGVAFCAITSCLATGVGTLTLEDSATNLDSGMVAVTGATVTSTSIVDNDLNGFFLRLDFYFSQQGINRPWFQVVRSSSVANVAFGDLYIVRYKENGRPVPPNATILAATYSIHI